MDAKSKPLLFLLCLFGFAGVVRAQYSDNIDIDAGRLYNADGTLFGPTIGLLELIASPVTIATPDGVFTPPTSNSFVTGGDILVQKFSMNYSDGPGEAGLDAIFAVGGTNALKAGYALQLRWFPGLTLASTSPGIDANYGAYRSDTPESGPDSGGIAWFVPSVGETLTTPNGYGFATMLAGGSNPETAGRAIYTVTPVPEPSSGGWLLGGAALCLTGWLARKPVGSACGWRT